MIVVDSNVIAYLYLPGDHTAASEKLLVKDAEWAVPLLWRSELRNILALYMRKQMLDFDKAFQIQREAEALVADNEFDVDSYEVLRLANESGCSAYDCEFIALASKLDVALYTADVKLRKAFPERARALGGA
jgi:predicted nucleic acid-binding protein